jgi:branched-chain amino acid transport system permease protein
MRLSSPSLRLLLLILLVLAVLPITSLMGLNAFYLDLAVRSMIFAIAATGLNLVLGYCGMISLGHAAFLLTGAYSVAIPNYFDIENGWIHFGLAIGSSALFALLTGAISLRTRGAGFIMITLAFAQMIYFLFVSMETFGGSDGISISFSSDFNLFSLENSLSLYYTSLVLLMLSLWVIYRLNASRFGFALAGSRLNPRRMHSLGYSPYKIQLTAYVIAGVICGIAGFLLANFVQFITPEMMDWFRSAELIFMVALGGVASLAGPVFGALSFVMLEYILSEWSLYWHLPFGLFLLAIAIFSKGGIVGLLDKRRESKANA